MPSNVVNPGFQMFELLQSNKARKAPVNFRWLTSWVYVPPVVRDFAYCSIAVHFQVTSKTTPWTEGPQKQ